MKKRKLNTQRKQNVNHLHSISNLQKNIERKIKNNFIFFTENCSKLVIKNFMYNFSVYNAVTLKLNAMLQESL